jgi:hypothetical protein
MTNPDGTTSNVDASNWSFIFGPRVAFGSVSLNL